MNSGGERDEVWRRDTGRQRQPHFQVHCRAVARSSRVVLLGGPGRRTVQAAAVLFIASVRSTARRTSFIRDDSIMLKYADRLVAGDAHGDRLMYAGSHEFRTAERRRSRNRSPRI